MKRLAVGMALALVGAVVVVAAWVNDELRQLDRSDVWS